MLVARLISFKLLAI